MAARPTWKGYLKISLVNIPVKVFPATDASATISFNQLHVECQTRIQQKRWCPTCMKDVPNTDIVKGFEFEKGRWVVMNDEDVDKVRVDSTRVINLEKFTDDVEIDPIYLDKPYYLAPDGPVAKEAFAVIREGMKGKAGIGKVALYGREYLIKVQPRERGLVMYTLRHASEIRSMDAIDELADMPEVVKPAEVALAQQVIGTFEGSIDFSDYRDDYQEGLREIVEHQDRRPRDRGAGSAGTTQGGEPHGGAAPEPRLDQRDGEGTCAVDRDNTTDETCASESYQRTKRCASEASYCVRFCAQR